jgi:hypothetical protein
MNLPDLQAYVKVPNNPFMTLTKFNIKDYSMTTTPFIIRDNLVMKTASKDQSDPVAAIADILQLQP